MTGMLNRCSFNRLILNCLALPLIVAVTACSGGSGPPVTMDLTAWAVSPTVISLDWTNGDDVNTYDVHQDGVRVGTTYNTDNDENVENLKPSTQYCFLIRAHKRSAVFPFVRKNEEISNTACATTLPNLPPTVPANLSVIVLTNPVNRMVLSWDNSADDYGVEGYKIYRDGNFLKSSDENSSIDDAVSPGKTYCYQVSAYDQSNAESPKSACGTIRFNLPPTVPVNLSVVGLPSPVNQMILSWDNSADIDGVKGYKIYRDGAYLKSWPENWSIDSTVSPGKIYCYQISAYDRYDAESPKSTLECEQLLVLRSGARMADDNGVDGESTSWTTVTELNGRVSAISLDSLDYSYLVYEADDEVKLLSNRTGSWNSTTVDSQASSPTLAIDNNNNIHLAFFHGLEAQYATKSSGSWVMETIQPGSKANSDTDVISIAPGMADKIHVSLRNGLTGQLQYASKAGGSWRTEDIGATANLTSDLVLDSEGNVHLSYVDGITQHLMYATNTSGDWSSRVVDNGDSSLSAPAMAIDIANNVHIAYYDDIGNALKIAHNVFGDWDITTIGNAGNALSLASDSTGSQHLSYIDKSDLKYATNQSGAWKTHTITQDIIPDEDFTKGTDIAIDSLDRVHIGYYRGDDISAYITNR